ncbi:MAG: WbqC family protein [Bacteroidales bacterium]|nr:WbqC family protein [Bacteroidales bacterium]
MNPKEIVVSTAYLPTIEYFAFIAKSEVFFMEDAETYQKQSYRNRAYIMTAGGVQTLILPTRHETQRSCIRDVRIDYKCPWQLKHWRAIESAYSGTPYFLYFRDFIYPFFEKKYEFLFDYNLELTEVLLQLFKIKKVPAFTETFEKEYHERLDLRNLIHPKKEPLLQKTPYHQVFDDRFPFIGNLSVIDLLFNAGPDLVYLLNLHS